MATSPRTRYAKCGDADIAYQVLGEGPVDLLLLTGALIPIDCMDDEPSMARFQRRLSSFGRLIRFDGPGIGLSDRGSPSAPPTLEERARAAVAVLDAVGSVRAAVLAMWLDSALGLALAARNSERVSSLVVVNGAARVLWAPDYPHGMSQEAADSRRRVVEPDAMEQGYDSLMPVAPSVASDSAFRAWFDRAGNLAATPAMARAMFAVRLEVDVRHLLPTIGAPTLVLHRRDTLFAQGHGRYMADHIDGAKYVELAGSDTLYWVGNTGPMLDEIEEFVTGVRGGLGAEHMLATVLFTDIVGSTDRAALLGDEGWRDLLDRHDQSVRTQFGRFRGREVKATGDGFVATFDSPARAIECALAIRETLNASAIEVRAGIHTGEIEVRGDDVAGMAVHIGARVSALAGPGEVLVSGAVPPLLAGSGIEFVDRGDHELKGVPGSWTLFAVRG
ncbi:MAG TPA: adenylate/guanylate cyclase domain-containing protein [Acidimicrobiales bacterium]|nr:adenylate/guanylate cyclase domain-containing protein [Acidimicrobiales bacterium]